MVNHANGNGYEGYNSTPSSPMKYTVNHTPSSRNKKWIVSRLCIGLAILLFIVILIVTNILTYTLTKSDNITIIKSDGLSEINITTYRPTLSVDQYTTIKNDILPEIYTTTTELSIDSDESVDAIQLEYRLPNSIVPIHYRIFIIPFLDEKNLTTSGNVTIDIRCVTSTNVIVLNFKDLDIADDNIFVHYRNATMEIKSIKKDVDAEQLSITLSDELTPNEIYSLSIKYNGKIREVPNGLYRSSFSDPKSNKTLWMINTLFSPAYARYAYPSFDEPLFKARFTFSIGRSNDMMSLSNMNLKGSVPIMAGWIWDHYETTPKMSTYLTAFLVAPSRLLMSNRGSGRKISLWTRYEDAPKTEIAIDFSQRILKFFENYFEIKFPLPKIDIVCVPAHDYDAMENWGLIIFKEDRLLVDQGSSFNSQRTLALILAHELAHQWFGNLVTPKWWDELWLKEGFSTYFQYLAMDYIEPKWNLFESFTLNEMTSAFLDDSLLISRAITRNVTAPNKEIFDSMIYNKGSSIVRMITRFFHADKLQMGLRKYLQAFMNSNADQNDLWKSLGEDEYILGFDKPIPLETVMKGWTSNPGYPVLNVVVDYTTKTAEITQERFTLDGNKNASFEPWWVPISYTTEEIRDFNHSEPKLWLAGVHKTHIENLSDGWILLNLDNIGYYRVNYNKENWVKLIDEFKSFSVVTKAQLISDSMNLAIGGYMDYDVALSLLNQLNDEFDYLPWKAATQPIYYLRNSLIKMPAYGDFREYLIILYGPVYSTLKSNTKDDIPWKVPGNLTEELHLENILKMTCLIGYDDCVKMSKIMFDKWMISPENRFEISEAIRPVIYCTAVSNGGRMEWDFIYRTFKNAATNGTKSNDEQLRLIEALGCSSEQWLLTRALMLILNPNSGLTKDDGIALYHSVASNHLGYQIAFSFIKDNWKGLVKHYNSTSIVFDMITPLVSYIYTPNEINELQSLIDNMKNGTKKQSIVLEKAIEQANNNYNWIKSNYFTLENWLITILKEILSQ